MGAGYNDLLKEEAESFDEQIEDRIRNGHLPDLRRTGRCEWFYNNTWRDGFYADLLYGRIVRQIIATVQNYLDLPHINVLEIACGPGHISLELSRQGYNVTGIDISNECIKVAQTVANEDPFIKSRGRLQYYNLNIFDYNPEEPFDLIVFSCALHHFGDQHKILSKVKSLLSPSGILFVSEPTKSNLSETETIIIYILRSLLSYTGSYYQENGQEKSFAEIESVLRNISNEYAYVDSSGNKTQSPLDNEADYNTMYSTLTKYFNKLESGADFTFFDRIVGGLRMQSLGKEHALAAWIRLLDDYLLKKGLTHPQQFYFIGRK